MFFHSCEDDYVVIDEPVPGKARKICGNQIPQSFNISSNELKIAFKSAERIGRPKPGFVATYTSGTTPGNLRKLVDNDHVSHDILFGAFVDDQKTPLKQLHPSESY